uniref:Integrase catalytic domain-containing protein n=1 Tax=Phytophthora ramorum TaxID=164328 RepID=H3GP40_PHYRM
MAKPLKYTAEEIPKNWDGRDWQTYKWAMKTVFQEKKLIEIVEGSMVKSGLSTAEKKEEFDAKQTQIMRMVGTSVPPDTLHQIRDKTTGTEMWSALCELYEGKANKTAMALRVRSLRNDLWSTKLSPGGDVNKHLSKMFNLRAELASLQYTVEDIDMVEMLLESVPNQPEFENMKAAIRYNPNFGAFTPSGVRDMIRAADSRQKEFRGKNGNGQRGSQKYGGNFGGAKDKSRKSDGQQQDAAKDAKKKKLRKCYICDSTDHLRADCPDREKEHSGGGANATEQKRKPRGNVTIRRDDIEPLQPEHEDLDVGVVTAANAHVTGNRSYYVAFTEDTSQSKSIHGVTPALASRIAGVGTVALVTEVNGLQVAVVLDDVFYVPGAEHGLLSPGLAAEQNFQFDYDREAMNFRVMDEGRTVIVATSQEATWGFFVSHPSTGEIVGPQDLPLCNVTAVKGVACLELWHERLGHTCPQYLKTMIDRGLVKGMLLTQRQQQEKKAHRKKLDRGLEQPNQVVYVDLVIPSKDNGTRYEAVLIIMDGFSRFVTMHMLTSKASEVINERIKEYILWAERQAGRSKRGVNRIKYLVQQVCTDKGGEFVNDAMAARYRAHGIEHICVGPKSSQLNLCERTHQSIVEMTKASMHHAGFPKSLWPEAMRNAVYVKNRVYNKGTQGVPFEMMFGAKPDLRHIRKFGALAYVHVPISPGRRKHHDNAKLGFVLGCAEDVVGCKVSFPEERTAKFVADLRIAEDVVYRDRHEVSVEDADLESLHFKRSENENEPDCSMSSDEETITELRRGTTGWMRICGFVTR